MDNNFHSLCDQCLQEISNNWQKNHSHKSMENAMVKVKFSDGNSTEAMWCMVGVDQGAVLLVQLCNDPNYLKQLQCGSFHYVKRTEITQHYNDDFTFEDSEADKLENIQEHLKNHP